VLPWGWISYDPELNRILIKNTIYVSKNLEHLLLNNELLRLVTPSSLFPLTASPATTMVDDYFARQPDRMTSGSTNTPLTVGL